MLVLEVTWLEVKLFLNHGGKISTCFLKLHSTCPKEDFKKKLFFENSVFFQTLRQFERTFTALGEKVFGRDIKVENCTLCLQSIMLRIKIIFRIFVSFPFIRTWNINFLYLWQQSFHAVYQNCTLRVHLNSLWDVGIRSEIV